MTFRVVTLNLEQDHKRWPARRPLIEAELARLKPDIVGLNEVSVPLQSAQLLRTALSAAAGVDYGLVQQTKVNSLSKVEAEAMLSRCPVIESGNLDYQAGDMVALVARVLVGGSPLDVYVTHLYRSRGDESLRLFQVQQLLEWIDTWDADTALVSLSKRNIRVSAVPRSPPISSAIASNTSAWGTSCASDGTPRARRSSGRARCRCTRCRNPPRSAPRSARRDRRRRRPRRRRAAGPSRRWPRRDASRPARCRGS